MDDKRRSTQRKKERPKARLQGWGEFRKAMRLSMGAFIHRSQWKEETKGSLSNYDLGHASKLSDIQIYTLSDKIRFLPVTVFHEWGAEQLEAISTDQIRVLTPLQLQSFVSNVHITKRQVERLIDALARPSHFHKIGDLCQGIHHAPDNKKVQGWCMGAVKGLSDDRLRGVLAVLAQTTTPTQFHCLLQGVPFEKLKELFEGDHYEPHDPAFQRLTHRVEVLEFENNLKLQELEMQMHNIDRVWSCSSIESILEMIDTAAEHGVLTSCFDTTLEAVAENARMIYEQINSATKVSREWQQLFERSLKVNGHMPITVLQSFAQCFAEYRSEQEYRHRCLVEKNLSPTHFLRHWTEEYLPYTYGSLEGRDAAESEKLFKQARRDADFLEEMMETLYEKVQRDARCGDFSVRFLLRLLVQKVFEPTHLFLATKEIEEILLQPGMLELLEIVELNFAMDKILHQLAETVANNLRAA